MSERIRVGILFGGRSAEHEISILSARNVLAALDRSRFEPVLIGIDRSGRWLLQEEALLLDTTRDPRLLKLNSAAPPATIEAQPVGTLARPSNVAPPLRLDVVFPVLHGPMGEDGTIQGLLELADIAYVGAGVLGSAVGMDKDVMKRLLRDAGLPIADFRVLRKADFERNPTSVCAAAAEVGFPLFSKPANLGSSVGVRRVASQAELAPALAHAFEFDFKVLAEEAVVGREIECAVLGGEPATASVPGEIIIRHADGFYSYEAKYVDESGAMLELPAQLSASQVEEVQQLSLRTFEVLACYGLARVDFFLREDGQFLVNEINTMPGFTAISMYPKLWELSGINRTELVSRLIELALERKRRYRALKTRHALPPGS